MQKKNKKTKKSKNSYKILKKHEKSLTNKKKLKNFFLVMQKYK